MLLRLDPSVHTALARWAADDLRSVNAQIEYLLRDALKRAGRLPGDAPALRRPGRPPQSGPCCRPARSGLSRAARAPPQAG